MRYAWANPAGEIGQWVSLKLWGVLDGWQNAVAFAAFDPALVGAVVFHDWQPTRGTMELTAFAETPRALGRKALKEIFAYPFDRAGCQMVKLSVDPGNETMRDIASRIGFTEHRIPRGRGAETDDILCTLTAEDWRASRYAS